MGFVRTPSEMQVIKRLAAHPLYLVFYDRISVLFETEMDFIANVLPPCFQLPAQPLVFTSISSWKVPREDFLVASLNVRATYEGKEGWYDLIHLLSTDMASYFGRDMYGECKKVGTMSIVDDGKIVRAHGERYGHRLIEIEAEFGEDLGPKTTDGTAFGLQAHIGTDRCSLLADPIVHVIRTQERRATHRIGKGKITLPGSPLDPTHTIPVGPIREIARGTGTYFMEPVQQSKAPGQRDSYAPYVFGRSYDFALPSADKVAEILKEYDLVE